MQFKRAYILIAIIYCSMSALVFCSPVSNEAGEIGSSSYDDLVNLFKEFREFQKPEVINGVPDYTKEAMTERWNGLSKFQKRLTAIDITEWPVSQQVDYHLVRAEMNGLDFFHRVLRPWSRDPYFYLMTQELAGPSKLLFLRYSEPPLPLSAEGAAELRSTLQSLPKLYEQAKINLTEGSEGLANLAIHIN